MSTKVPWTSRLVPRWLGSAWFTSTRTGSITLRASGEDSPRSTAAVPWRAENAEGSIVTVTVAGVTPDAGDTVTPRLDGWKLNPLWTMPGSITVKVREIGLLSQKFPRMTRLGADVVTRDMESR